MLLLYPGGLVSSNVKDTLMASQELSRVIGSRTGLNASKMFFFPSGSSYRHGNSSNSSKASPSAPSTHNMSPSQCCFVVQDTIDVKYWRGE